MTAIFVENVMPQIVQLHIKVVIGLLYLFVGSYIATALYKHIEEEIVYNVEKMKPNTIKLGGERRGIVIIIMYLLLLMSSFIFFIKPEDIIAYFSLIYVALLTGVASTLISMNRSIVVITNDYLRNDMMIYNFNQIEFVSIENYNINIKMHDQVFKKIRNLRKRDIVIMREILKKNEAVILKGINAS